LQRHLGNEAVQDLIRGKTLTGVGPGGAAGELMRQAEEGERASSATGPATAAVQIDASQLGVREELPGHGDNQATHDDVSAPGAESEGSRPTPNVDVVVAMTVNPPTEEPKPAADIAEAHDRPGVAGWTTPAYEIEVPHVDQDDIDVDVTLDFNIELAEEYTGDTLKVLRDHEYGHVEIGKDVGSEHLVDGLHDDLSALPDFSSAPPIQGAIVSTAQEFNAAEGNASRAYDNIDYPRMQQAYLGARTPLTDLEAASTKIASMAEALRDFNTALPQADEDDVVGLAQEMIDARDGLDDDELARLQYNGEFKALVRECQGITEAFVESYHWDLWIIEFSTLDEAARQKLNELKIVLEGFTWEPPV
jgi:hypothetical protein